MRKEQSATRMRKLKGRRSALEEHIECLTISLASPSNNSLKTFLSNNSPLSNIPSTTLTPLNPVLTASFASVISSAPRTSSSTAGTASLTIAPFTTRTEACLTLPSMPQPNPPIIASRLPGSLVVLATLPFQSRTYSASPSPSPSTRTTPPLAYPINSVQVTPPTHKLQTCRLNSTSHWGDYHPNRSAMLSPPPTWNHPHSVPLLMPSSKLQTAIISNISTKSVLRTKNTRLRSTSSKKTSSMQSPVSLITRRPLSKPPRGTSLTSSCLHSVSPLEMEQKSPPSGSNNLTTAVSLGIASTMEPEILLDFARTVPCAHSLHI